MTRFDSKLSAITSSYIVVRVFVFSAETLSFDGLIFVFWVHALESRVKDVTSILSGVVWWFNKA